MAAAIAWANGSRVCPHSTQRLRITPMSIGAFINESWTFFPAPSLMAGNDNSMAIMALCMSACVVCSSLAISAGAFFFADDLGIDISTLMGSGSRPGASTAGQQNANITCPAGKLPNVKGQCVPIRVHSPKFGGKDGKKSTSHECLPGHYIAGINVGYDDAVKELKYITAGCTDGSTFVAGRESPSNLGSILTSVFTMGMVNIPGNSGYENQTWSHPHDNMGWGQVSMLTEWGGDPCCHNGAHGGSKAKAGSRVRAFGPFPRNMFGVPKNKTRNYTVKPNEIKTWRCDSAGEAPAGKKYVIDRIDVRSGTALDSLKFRCSLVDIPQ